MVDPFAQWQQHGSVYFWRFDPQQRELAGKKGLAGWHFAADAAGKDSLIELLDLLTKSDYPTKRTIKLSHPPASVSTVPGSADRQVVSPSALRLVFQPDWDERGWRVESDGDHVEIGLGRCRVAELAEAINRAKTGGFDFSVGPSDNPPQNIWFW
jgi:hypothetical protein